MGLNGFHKEEEVKAPSIMGLEVFLSVSIPEGILAKLCGN